MFAKPDRTAKLGIFFGLERFGVQPTDPRRKREKGCNWSNNGIGGEIDGGVHDLRSSVVELRQLPSAIDACRPEQVGDVISATAIPEDRRELAIGLHFQPIRHTRYCPLFRQQVVSSICLTFRDHLWIPGPRQKP
jgi:hypothetical protein